MNTRTLVTGTTEISTGRWRVLVLSGRRGWTGEDSLGGGGIRGLKCVMNPGVPDSFFIILNEQD